MEMRLIACWRPRLLSGLCQYPICDPLQSARLPLLQYYAESVLDVVLLQLNIELYGCRSHSHLCDSASNTFLLRLVPIVLLPITAASLRLAHTAYQPS